MLIPQQSTSDRVLGIEESVINKRKHLPSQNLSSRLGETDTKQINKERTKTQSNRSKNYEARM